MLAGRYDPSKIISVGDQEETDLRPARERGMKTLQVKNPSEINQLLV
jgi:FMN phosphatase YigB (HAD superfamily)